MEAAEAGPPPPPPAPLPTFGYALFIVEAMPEVPQQFSFQSDISACTSFSLRDDGTVGADRMLCLASAPGTYSVVPQVPAGWLLMAAECSDGSPLDGIALEVGETVSCTLRFVAISALARGDVDCDGQATEADVRTLLRHVTGLPLELPPGCPSPGQHIGGGLWGDIDADGDLDSADAASLLRMLQESGT